MDEIIKQHILEEYINELAEDYNFPDDDIQELIESYREEIDSELEQL